MRRQKGFTLIELMIVIGIIALLTAIAIPNFQKYIRKARMTKAAAVHRVTAANRTRARVWGRSRRATSVAAGNINSGMNLNNAPIIRAKTVSV